MGGDIAAADNAESHLFHAAFPLLYGVYLRPLQFKTIGAQLLRRSAVMAQRQEDDPVPAVQRVRVDQRIGIEREAGRDLVMGGVPGLGFPHHAIGAPATQRAAQQVEVGIVSRRFRQLLDNLANGSLKVLVGTHALLEDPVVFNRLGLVVVDEQHRFGVHQRDRLLNKGLQPHLLTMTATPIPRTLALSMHGDLDVSQIDELPPGRTPIRTRMLTAAKREKAYELIREEVARGQRAYVVLPLVEESEKLELRSAVEVHAELASEVFPELTVGLLHGRLNSADKQSVLRDFADGRSQVLVSTTVVEVGVDVPEASVMVIDHAERFGLAQLHQLRGRVGRSSTQSSCLLVYYPPLSETASKRLSVMRETNDGFVIAEEDLSLRGPGEFLGQRQSGVPEFVLADLAVHRDLLAMARTEAHTMLAANASSDINLLLCLFERDSAVKFLAAG